MGDGIQRYAPCDECSCLDMRDGEGAYVLFTDHESAVAAAVEERDRQWRERIEEKALMCDDHAGRFDDPEFPAMAEALRSLLSPEGRERDGVEGGLSPAGVTNTETNTNPEEGEN